LTGDSEKGYSIVGKNGAMSKGFTIIGKVAGNIHPVLVQGESGTGKELVSRAIHFTGPRRDGPFVPVDCGALVPTLMESELFGHEKGSFTGADQVKQGRLQIPEGGTIFFDEIGELPLELQAKLLRALQQKEFRRVGKYQIRSQRRTCNRRHEQNPGGGSPNRQIPQGPIFSSQRLNHQASAHERAG
jgi:transcriptional regulator with GAF, ATPase, and Fis domain